MIRLLIIIVLVFEYLDSNSQNSKSLPVEFDKVLSSYDHKKYVAYSKKILRESLRDHHQQSGLYAAKFSNQVEYKIIPLMIISGSAAEYNPSDDILKYLEFSKSPLVETSLLFKDSKHIGRVDCSSEILYGKSQEYHKCSFDDALDYQQKLIEGWKIIEEREPDFVFSVRFIRNCWWFIIDDKCFILNLQDLQIQEANDFIRSRCSPENIAEYAKGNWKYFCI